MVIASAADYEAAVRKLFPRGEYWDRQFADPESDASLFCRAKAPELLRLRGRMRDLFTESKYEVTVELIDDWERVLLGYTNSLLPLAERQNILTRLKNPRVNKTVIAAIAEKYGLVLVDIVFPFKPAFFGVSECGRSFFSRPVFFSVIYVILSFQDEGLKTEARRRIDNALNNSYFGRACFGTGKFLDRSYFSRDFSSRIFLGMEHLEEFEKDVTGVLLSSNIPYFLYEP
jgi:uncharacterized protein YmfQ (DUF2313 family)